MANPFSGKLGDGDIALLREFVVIVESGGLSAAETRLNKGKSAISLNLKKLEIRLGMTLCLRGRAGFRLTEEGRIAHSAAVQLLAELDRFGDHIANASVTLSGSVTFHADDSFLFVFQRPISAAIAELTTDHPRLHLDMRMSDPEQVTTAVLDGIADIGLTAAPRRTELLTYTRVFTERMGLYCGQAHPLYATDQGLPLEELGRHKAISTYMDQTPAVRELLRHMVFAASAPTMLSRIQLILSGAYIGFLPPEVAAPWVERGDLRELRTPGARFEHPCHLILRKSEPEKPAVRFLKNALLRKVQSMDR